MTSPACIGSDSGTRHRDIEPAHAAGQTNDGTRKSIYLLEKNCSRIRGTAGPNSCQNTAATMAWSATNKPRAMMAQAFACLGRVADPNCSTRELQHFLQHHSMRTCKALWNIKKFQITRSIHHRGCRQSSVLVYLHFLCIFKLLAADAATLEYAPISPNLPLYDDSLHTQRTRKWPPSPSSPPVPTGSRSDERAALLRDTFLRRDDAHRWALPKRSPGWIRGWRRTSRPFPASRPLATSSTFI